MRLSGQTLHVPGSIHSGGATSSVCASASNHGFHERQRQCVAEHPPPPQVKGRILGAGAATVASGCAAPRLCARPGPGPAFPAGPAAARRRAGAGPTVPARSMPVGVTPLTRGSGAAWWLS